MLRNPFFHWVKRHAWQLYLVLAAVFLANIAAQTVLIVSRISQSGTVAALVFSGIAFVCAVAVSTALWFSRSTTNGMTPPPRRTTR
ncbi:MAG: hypothetical protein H7248_02410 [Microbacteriaceae bacterium]|nr:hypothetical protein [Microbacteriaceae bacterium]